MNLYISDLHFGHKNVIGFDHRPFADVDEMDNYIIRAWNSRVQNDDSVFIVGDVCYRNEKSEQWYLRQLKGHKILIVGNHDDKLLNNRAALRYLEGIEQDLLIKDGNIDIYLNHVPVPAWENTYNEAWHIYGHIHNKKKEVYEKMRENQRALNCGCRHE